MLFGIDYGSKLAGTTVIASLGADERIQLICSEKKQNADEMILNEIKSREPSLIGIDAPLSLPSVYLGKGTDYFYRACDRELKAMSPLFLGGLTARAMKLKAQTEIPFIEVYPGALARQRSFSHLDYKKKEANYIGMLDKLDWPFDYGTLPVNSHQLDAILALYIVWLFTNERAQQVGDNDEGLIYF